MAQISADEFTTCAVTTGGGVKCWGYGPLGNGTFGSSSTPVDVTGLTSGVASVSVGGGIGCAVTVAGAVKCWGNGLWGALGNGSTTPSPVPVDVTGLGSGVRAVTAAFYGGCALTASQVRCWGDNRYGAVGDGTRTARLTPVPVVGLGPDVRAIDGKATSRCALTTAGAVSCWGDNRLGRLGVGSSKDVVLTPRPVRGLGQVSAVSAGSEVTCAGESHRTWCWGSNQFGALGDGTSTDRTAPTPVVGLTSAVVGVAAGYDHSCAVTATGRVYCWGLGDRGQLGHGTVTSSSFTPVRVLGPAS